MSNSKIKLTKAQQAAAKALLDARPACIPGTRVVINRTECSAWFATVTAKIKELKLTHRQVGDFCDMAGVPD